MKKFVYIIMSLLMSICYAQAETKDAILVTTTNGTTCYALSSMPKVTYAENGTVAQLTIKGHATPVLSIPLNEGQKLVVTYGVYETGIDDVTSDKVSISERNGRKVVTGGRLIIVGKDGKFYSADGKSMTTE